MDKLDQLLCEARALQEPTLSEGLHNRLVGIPRKSTRKAIVWLAPAAVGAAAIVAAAVFGVVLPRTRSTPPLPNGLVVTKVMDAVDAGRLPGPVELGSGCGEIAANDPDPLAALCTWNGCCIRSEREVRCASARLIHYEYGCHSIPTMTLLVVPEGEDVSYRGARTSTAVVANQRVLVAERGRACAIEIFRGRTRWLLISRADPLAMLSWLKTSLPTLGEPS